MHTYQLNVKMRYDEQGQNWRWQKKFYQSKWLMCWKVFKIFNGATV